jgi:NADPH-dependent glutamate synthase beta subunit-like oxidoreductase
MDAEHYRLRDFLTRTAQPYEWCEVGTPEADRLLEKLGLTDGTLPLETSRVGVFAAGDVRHGSTKRVAAAVGEGSMVASLIFSRLAELGVTY